MKGILLALHCFIAFVSSGQLKDTIVNYTHYALVHKSDTIDFIVADTTLEEVKPVLLFCQGSQPVPLFVDFGEERIAPIPLSNFNLDNMKGHFHVVVISMPKTPVVAPLDHLNRSYNYILDSTSEYSYRPEFIESDYLDNYVNRANRVIKYLRKQNWVDKTELVVAGHSQGSRVAVGIAYDNKHVTSLGLFGYNPMRRIDQLVWAYRKQAQNGEISWREADSLQQNQYAFYQEILNDDSLANNPMLKSWRSFSVSSIEDLSKLEIPLYIAYGSNDIVAEYCDLLPLYFAEQNKTNYIIKRYPNLDHNFFPLDESFKPDYQNGQWSNVMDAFILWSQP